MSLELKHVAIQKDTNKSISLKSLLDKTKSVERLFYHYTGTYIDHLISSKDLENVTKFDYFMSTTNVKGILKLNISNATRLYYAFCYNESLEELHLTSTKKVTNYTYAFSSCTNLHTLTGLDLLNNEFAIDTAFKYCTNLTNLIIKNIKLNIQIGSGASWGHLLTLDSLVNTCKECIDTGSSRTLTVGTDNLNKLSRVYVKLTDVAEEDETLPKLPMEVCKSTDEGAMLISDYMALKNWTLA